MDGLTPVNVSLDPLDQAAIDKAFTENFGTAQAHPLRLQLGKSKGRITLEQHLERLDWVIRTIPQDIWPSTAYLSNRFVGQTAIIVGGGHSLLDTFSDLRLQIDDRGDKCKVFAPNKSHDWLINGRRKGRNTWERHPVIPDFGVLTDPSDFVITYQTPHPKVTYLLSTMVDARVFAKFLKAGSRAFIWVPTYEGDGADIGIAAQRYKDAPMHFVSGGSTVGLRTINLALAFGFDVVDLYGFDSCYAPGEAKKLYAYQKPVVVHEIVDATIACRQDGTRLRYRTNSMMAKQAMEFDDMLYRLPNLEVDGRQTKLHVRVHGDGLIPWLAWKASQINPMVSHATPERMEKKYGTGSYDYVESKPL